MWTDLLQRTSAAIPRALLMHESQHPATGCCAAQHAFRRSHPIEDSRARAVFPLQAKGSPLRHSALQVSG